MNSQLQRETARRTLARTARKHGLSGHPLYDLHRYLFRPYGWTDTWEIPVDPDFYDVQKFVGYVESNLPPRPKLGPRAHHLVPIDWDRGYVPGNVEWAPPPERKPRRRRRYADMKADEQAHLILTWADCPEDVLGAQPVKEVQKMCARAALCACEWEDAFSCGCDWASARAMTIQLERAMQASAEGE